MKHKILVWKHKVCIIVIYCAIGSMCTGHRAKECLTLETPMYWGMYLSMCIKFQRCFPFPVVSTTEYSRHFSSATSAKMAVQHMNSWDNTEPSSCSPLTFIMLRTTWPDRKAKHVWAPATNNPALQLFLARQGAWQIEEPESDNLQRNQIFQDRTGTSLNYQALRAWEPCPFNDRDHVHVHGHHRRVHARVPKDAQDPAAHIVGQRSKVP